MTLLASSTTWYPNDNIQLNYSTGSNVLTWHNSLSGTNWTEICFQSVETTAPKFWVIFNKANLESYLHGLSFNYYNSHHNNTYSTPFRRSSNTPTNFPPTNPPHTGPLFSTAGVVESSGDYVWFQFNSQPKNPYVRACSTQLKQPTTYSLNNCPQIYNENSSAGGPAHNSPSYPHNTDLGVFVR